MAEDINSGVQGSVPTEPTLAKVISHVDTQYMGTLEVQLLKAGAGNDSTGSQVQQVRFMSPFWGSTSIEFVTNENDYNNTQKSYGMWFIPPDVGSLVVVIFLNGDPARGYWIGCVPDDNMNFMVPGIAATQNVVDSTTADASGRVGRVPVAEYNKLENQKNGDASQFKKPKHPFAQVLVDQGLIADDIRGTTSSSARRETPSAVFGISTPGPIDKNGPKGTAGKAEHKVSIPISRLGGATFVMDDGDQNGENELVRIRTRTGHQILLHKLIVYFMLNQLLVQRLVYC